jgi:hypothetical protein
MRCRDFAFSGHSDEKLEAFVPTSKLVANISMFGFVQGECVCRRTSEIKKVGCLGTGGGWWADEVRRRAKHSEKQPRGIREIDSETLEARAWTQDDCGRRKDVRCGCDVGHVATRISKHAARLIRCAPCCPVVSCLLNLGMTWD